MSPRSAKIPIARFAFLEVWNTVPAVNDAICYGVEGLTYNLVDGQVELVPDSYEMWGGQNWTTGDSFISYTLVGETKDKWDVYLAWNESAKVDPLLGFNYDSTDTSAEVAALNAALAEYLNGVPVFGMVDDIDASIQALNDALVCFRAGNGSGGCAGATRFLLCVKGINGKKRK